MNILNRIIIIFILLSIPTFLFSRYTETRLEKGLTSNLIFDDFSTYTNEKIKTIVTFRELKFETKRYYFGARYYDPKLSRWTAADPPIARGDYLPNPGDFDTNHNYYFFLAHDTTSKLKGMGGIFNPFNLNAYLYAGNNPVKFVDPDGNEIYSINRQLGGTEVRGIWNPKSHTYLATSDQHGNVKDVASWGKVDGMGEKAGKWYSTALPTNSAKEKDFIRSEKNIAGNAIMEDNGLKLTNDNKLDAYIGKAAKLLSMEGSPSKHKWNPGQTCKDESQRLLGTALQIYKKETGGDYKGLTPAGQYNQTKMDDKKFEQLYKKAFGK